MEREKRFARTYLDGGAELDHAPLSLLDDCVLPVSSGRAAVELAAADTRMIRSEARPGATRCPVLLLRSAERMPVTLLRRVRHFWFLLWINFVP
jgi:hypothetical protein